MKIQNRTPRSTIVEDSSSPTNEEITTPITSPVEQAQPQTVPIAAETMIVSVEMWNALLDRVGKQENKPTDKPVVHSTKPYEGPLTLQYSLFPRNDADDKTVFVPIVSWRSTRREPTRGLVYQNQYGATVDNQIVILTLADGTTEKVEPGFLAASEKSGQVIPMYVTDNKGSKIVGTDFTPALIQMWNKQSKQASSFTFNASTY